MSAELTVISLVPHPVNATGVAKDAWTRPSMDDVTWQTLRIPRQRGGAGNAGAPAYGVQGGLPARSKTARSVRRHSLETIKSGKAR